MNKLDLGEIMMHRGWIDRSQLNRALAIQRQIPGRLGSCLLEIDATTENHLVEALAEQMGVPAALPEDLKNVPEETIRLIPARLAVRCQAVPFRLVGNRLSVALVDTKNLALQDELGFASGKRLLVHVASEARIFEALDHYYGEECPARYARLLDRLNRSRYLWNGARSRSASSWRPVPPPRSTPAATRPPANPPSNGTVPPATTGFDFSLPELPGFAAPLPHPEAETASTLPFRPRAQEPSSSTAPDSAGGAPTTGEAMTDEAMTDEAANAGLASARYPEPPTIHLTDAERAALVSSERERSGGSGGEGLEERLARENEREAVGAILLESLRARFQRGALLVASAEGARGWSGTGAGFDERRFARFSVDFEHPSAFLNLHLGSPFAVGPLAGLPAHEKLLSCWHRRPGEEPAECWLVPVHMRQRMVVVLYGEGVKPDGQVGGLVTLQWLAEEAAKAFENCILRRKMGRSKSAPEV